MAAISLENGKYELIHDEASGALRAYLHGEPWADFTGNKVMYLLMVEALKAQQPVDEYETREDGKRVRKDRWEWAIRRIVALLWGNRKEFELDDVVKAVRRLAPARHHDDEALVASVAGKYGAVAPQPAAEPYLHVYEYESPFGGIHREFTPREWNGRGPTRTVPLYTAPSPT